jgi:hypothetical protein
LFPGFAAVAKMVGLVIRAAMAITEIEAEHWRSPRFESAAKPLRAEMVRARSSSRGFEPP